MGEGGTSAHGAWCPASEPTVGAPCPVEFASDFGSFDQCAYGPYADEYCDRQYVCVRDDKRFSDGAHWAVPESYTPYFCPGYEEQQKPFEDTACPASYADVAQGAACTARSVLCSYPEGLCSCDEGANPQARHPLQWACAPVPNGCPARPPLTGVTCTTEGQNCDYGSCTFSNAPVKACRNGAWDLGTRTPRCF